MSRSLDHLISRTKPEIVEAAEKKAAHLLHESVWDAIEDTPENALNMRLRSELMRHLAKRVEGWAVGDEEAAHRLGITESCLIDLMEGRISVLSLDQLVSMAARAGMGIDLVVKQNE